MIVELLETLVHDHISMSQSKIVYRSLSSSLNGMFELLKNFDGWEWEWEFYSIPSQSLSSWPKQRQRCVFNFRKEGL